MKALWKKIVALICVMSLCLGLFPATTMAVESYTGKLTITGAEVTNNTDPTNFYIKGTDNYTVGSNWANITMVPDAEDTESGIFIDGVRINNYYSAHDENVNNVKLIKYNDANCYYYIANIPNVTVGSVLMIKGTFRTYGNWLETNIYDSTPTVFEESVFMWNGSQWIDCYGGKLTIKGAEVTNNTDQTNFYIKGTDSYTVGSNWANITMVPNAEDTKSGIFIDGVRINNYYSAHDENANNVKLIKYNDANCYYYIANIPNVQAGSVLTIKGAFRTYGNWLETNIYDSTPTVFRESQFQWDGTKWVDYVEPKAYSGKLTVDGAQITTTKNGYIYLKGTDTYLSGKSSEEWETNEAKLQAKTTDVDSGIFVNDVKQPGGLLKKYLGTNNWYFAEGFTAASTGDIVSVKGTFYSLDGLAKVTFEESKFQWDGTKWVDYEEVISYQGILSYVDGANASNSVSVYLETTDNMPVDSWDHAFYGMDKNQGESAENGIWLDGKYQSGAHMKRVGGRYYVGGFETANTNSILKIAGTFICDTYNAKVTFEEAQFQWDGNEWKNYKETINYPGTLTYESGDSSCIYFAGTDAKPLTSWENELKALNAESGIYVEGTKITGAYLKKYAANKYYVGGFGTVAEGTEVTIKGLFGVNGEYETVTLEEVTVQFEGNCWIDSSSITSYAEGTVWLDLNTASTSIHLYLKSSADVHETYEQGWEISIGTTGIYKNGEPCTVNMKNVHTNSWFVDLGSAGITVGDKLTIRGTFGYNGRYVKVAEYNLWYTNDGWKITPAITSDTQLYGDVNGDNELNSLDLVRLIKYINKQPVTIYKKDASGNNTGADANGIDGINDRDRLKIYEYILEGAKRTVNGSYTVEYYPVYLDDEDIKLGAYNGPRTSGYEDYSYTSGGTLTSRPVAESFLNSTEFERYKNAGLNTLLHEYDGAYSSKAAGIGYGVDDGNFRNYLAFAKEAGLNIYITSMGLSSYIKFEGAGNGPTSIDFNGDGNLSSTAVTIDETKYGWDYNGDGVVSASAQMPEIFYYSDNIKHRDLNSAVYPGQKMTILEADISELFEYIVDNGYQDIFKGIMMPDEPWLVAKERYTSAINLINALAAEYGLDIDYQGCLYPSYAETDAIGINYTTYVEAFGTARKSLMYDFYPLQNTKKWYQSSSKNELNTEWLTNLELVAKQGKSNGYTTGITLQSSGFETAQDSGIFANQAYRRDPQSDADIQFQVYSSLAFGIKKINYFTYWEKQFQGDEKFTSSMVEYPAAGGTEGEETAVYGYVKNANTEITKFDHVFMDYDWVETKTVGSSSLFSGVTSANISGVTVNSSSNASIISHMYDSEKQLDGYWLVNMAEPSTSTKATLNVTFAGKNKAMVYINGEETIVDLTNGVYSADLAVGEGIFIIPLNIQ